MAGCYLGLSDRDFRNTSQPAGPIHQQGAAFRLGSIFGGFGDTTREATRDGLRCAVPLVDLKRRGAMQEPEECQKLIEKTDTSKPRLVMIAFPCRGPGQLAASQHSFQERRRRLKKFQKETEAYLDMAEEVLDKQVSRLDQAVVE